METKTITFTVTFTGGAGSISFTGVDGLPKGKSISTDSNKPVSIESFTAEQSTGSQIVIVGGIAPDKGNIVVDIKDGNTLIVSKTYLSGEFNRENIGYSVPEVVSSTLQAFHFETKNTGANHIQVNSNQSNAIITVSVPPMQKITLHIEHSKLND